MVSVIKKIKEKWDTYKRQDLADELGISLSTLYSIAKKNGLYIDEELSKRAKNKWWSEEEINFLKENYDKLSVEKISQEIGRTFSAIYCKMKLLGLYKQTIKWTEDEIKKLCEIYSSATTEEIVNSLSNHSLGGIQKKAKFLGLKRKNIIRPPWTEEEKNKVIELAKRGYTDKQIAEKLNRGIDKIKEIRRTEILYIWTDDEIKLLKEKYSCSTAKELELLFPNKKRGKIRSKANRLGLKKDKETYKKCFHIKTEISIKILRKDNWRSKILERDNFKCALCKLKDKTGINLHAHHIKPVRDCSRKERKDINNGICLCIECHKKVNGREYDYLLKFSRLLKNK